VADTLELVAQQGPIRASATGIPRPAPRPGHMWNWHDGKVALEYLFFTGQVTAAGRVNFERLYDLPERVLPAGLLGPEPDDEECVRHLAGVTARALGVATHADLIDYHRLQRLLNGRKDRTGFLDDAARAAGLAPVTIPGPRSAVAAWADPGALAEAADPRRERHRVTLLSPFDSLIWDRKRTLRLFGFEHSLEAYVPKAKRIHGYFVMPLLAGGRLVGRADPARRGTTLIARKVTLDRPSAAEPMARALREAATWVGCDQVELGQVEPAASAPRLRALLS
jgi:uncharacterized protein YcaQ